MIRKLSLVPGLKRETADILSDIGKMNEQIDNKMRVYDAGTLGRFLFLYAELCSSLNLDGELLLHNTVTNLKNHIQQSGNRLKNDGKSNESLTFNNLGVYLNHVEGEIE